MRSINIYLLRMLIIGNHNVLATHATTLIGMVRLSPTALWLHTAQWSDSEQREYFRVELLVSMNIYHLSTNIHNEGTILKSYHFLLKGWHGMIGQGTGVYFYFFILLLLVLFIIIIVVFLKIAKLFCSETSVLHQVVGWPLQICFY